MTRGREWGPEGGAALLSPSRVFFPGVLPDIEQFFDIGDSSSGLIQTGEWRPLLGTQQLFFLFYSSWASLLDISWPELGEEMVLILLWGCPVQLGYHI